jgi:hypothetical protein
MFGDYTITESGKTKKKTREIQKAHWNNCYFKAVNHKSVAGGNMVNLNGLSQELVRQHCDKAAPHDIMMGLCGFNDAFQDITKKDSQGSAGTALKKNAMINTNLDEDTWERLQEWDAVLKSNIDECVDNCFRMRCFRQWLGTGTSGNWQAKREFDVLSATWAKHMQNAVYRNQQNPQHGRDPDEHQGFLIYDGTVC